MARKKKEEKVEIVDPKHEPGFGEDKEENDNK